MNLSNVFLVQLKNFSLSFSLLFQWLPIIIGIIVHFRFHIRCISVHKLLYFNFFSTSFCTTFLSAGIATSISVHVFSFLFLIVISGLLLLLLLLLLFREYRLFFKDWTVGCELTYVQYLGPTVPWPDGWVDWLFLSGVPNLSFKACMYRQV